MTRATRLGDAKAINPSKSFKNGLISIEQHPVVSPRNNDAIGSRQLGCYRAIVIRSDWIVDFRESSWIGRAVGK